MSGDEQTNKLEQRIASIENRLQSIDQVLDQVKERNLRVESDKAWEGSKTRIILVCVITYIVATGVFFSLGAQRPFLDAVVPTLGFLLSSQSIPLAKKLWLKSLYKRD